MKIIISTVHHRNDNQRRRVILHKIWLLVVLAVILSAVGCAERNDPVYPEEEYALNLISQTPTPGWAKDVWVSGDTAYVADDEVGISIWDVSNPDSVQLFEVFHVSAAAKSVRIVNTDSKPLMLVRWSGGHRFYDLNLRSYQFNFGSSGATDIYVNEIAPDSLHISTTDFKDDGLGILKLFYVDDWGWNNAQQKFSAPSYGSYRGVCMDADTTYLAHSQVGLDIIHVDYTTQGGFPITSLGNVDTPGSAYDVALNRDKTHAIVADFQGGIQVIDVTDQSNPRIVGSLLPEGADRIIKVEAVGDTAYFIDEYTALLAVDVSQPSQPRLKRMKVLRV